MSYLLLHTLLAVAPLIALIAITGLASNLMQVGFMFSGTPLQPSLSRLNPIKGAGRIFSRNGLVELLKATIKLTIITWVTWGTLQSEFLRLIPFHGSDLAQVLPVAGQATYHLALRVTLALLVVALATTATSASSSRKASR